MSNVTVTLHGGQRLAERMDIRSEYAVAYAGRVWTKGKKIDAYHGAQRKALEDIRTRHTDDGIELRLFGGDCYIFSDNGALITCYPLPQWFEKAGKPKPPRFYGGDDEDVPALFFQQKKAARLFLRRTSFVARARFTMINKLITAAICLAFFLSSARPNSYYISKLRHYCRNFCMKSAYPLDFRG